MVNYYKRSFEGLSQEVWLISLMMLINRAGTMVLPFLTLYLTVELGFSVVDAGILVALFGVGSLFGGFLGGFLTDRYGSVRVILFSLLGAALAFPGLLLFTEFWPIAAMILVASTIADTIRPAVMTAVNQYSKPENITRSISLLRMAFNLGISLGPAAGGFIAATLGYHWLFIIDGITCFCAAAFAWFFLPRTRLPAETDSRMVSAVTYPEVVERNAYTDIPFLIFIGCSALGFMAFIEILSTVPLYFERQLGFSEDRVGLFFAANGLLVFLLEMPIVYAIERKWGNYLPVAIGALFIGLGYLFLNFLPGWLLPTAILVVLLSIGEIIMFPFVTTNALKRAHPKRKGQYMGLNSVAISSGFIFAPYLGTLLLDSFGFEFLWYNVFLWTVICAVGVLLIRSKMQTDTSN